MYRAACGRASALRGRAEMLGEGVSLCGGERKSSAGKVLCGRRGMHRTVCGRASALRGGAEVLGKGVSLCGECIAQPVGVHRAVCGRASALRGRWKCSGRACRCAGARGGLRRGVGCEVGGECIAQSAGVRRSSAGNASRSLWACIAQPAGVRRDCVGERKCSGRACRCAGASEGLRRGMVWEVGGFNAHSPQQHARTRIIIYTSTLFAP